MSENTLSLALNEAADTLQVFAATAQDDDGSTFVRQLSAVFDDAALSSGGMRAVLHLLSQHAKVDATSAVRQLIKFSGKLSDDDNVAHLFPVIDAIAADKPDSIALSGQFPDVDDLKTPAGQHIVVQHHHFHVRNLTPDNALLFLGLAERIGMANIRTSDESSLHYRAGVIIYTALDGWQMPEQVRNDAMLKGIDDNFIRKMVKRDPDFIEEIFMPWAKSFVLKHDTTKDIQDHFDKLARHVSENSPLAPFIVGLYQQARVRVRQTVAKDKRHEAARFSAFVATQHYHMPKLQRTAFADYMAFAEKNTHQAMIDRTQVHIIAARHAIALSLPKGHDRLSDKVPLSTQSANVIINAQHFLRRLFGSDSRRQQEDLVGLVSEGASDKQRSIFYEIYNLDDLMNHTSEEILQVVEGAGSPALRERLLYNQPFRNDDRINTALLLTMMGRADSDMAFDFMAHLARYIPKKEARKFVRDFESVLMDNPARGIYAYKHAMLSLETDYRGEDKTNLTVALTKIVLKHADDLPPNVKLDAATYMQQKAHTTYYWRNGKNDDDMAAFIDTVRPALDRHHPVFGVTIAPRLKAPA